MEIIVMDPWFLLPKSPIGTSIHYKLLEGEGVRGCEEVSGSLECHSDVQQSKRI